MLSMKEKKGKSRGRIFLLLSFCFFILFYRVVAMAANWPTADLTAESAIVVDAETGAVLFEKNGDVREYPASITKVMTALVVLEHTSLEDKVTFSHDAVYNVDRGSSNAQIEEGDVLTVNDCLHALLLKSANEAANALAEHVAGSREAFAEMMNEKAKELGCTGTHFQNPSGLQDENHYTTARDMALIGMAAFQNKEFLEIEKNLSHTLGNLKRLPEGNTIYMEHKMMLSNTKFYDKRVVAGKTGYTQIAGNTLISLAEDQGRKVVTVVLKDKNPSHYTDTKTLLDLAFSETENQTLGEHPGALEALRKELVSAGKITEENKIHFLDTVKISLPKGASQDGLQYAFKDIEGDAPASALGKVQILLDGKVVGSGYIGKDQNIQVILNNKETKKKVAVAAVTVSGFTILAGFGFFLFGGGALYGAKNLHDERKRKKKWKERRKKNLEELQISEEEFKILVEKRKSEKKKK